ncbi:hypothetical protein [Persephonella sp. KM09-Lau-8]|uniref:hypothetical protein n=1 Tax=Persephonella sp. KM09-Lau-8 TaxID=1158345 RepID=UPI0004973BB5|nr:hypothetical protein [Persephonella sp. KM09-Lau-8]
MKTEQIILQTAKEMGFKLTQKHAKIIEFEIEKYKDFFKDILEKKEPIIKEFFTGKNKDGEKVLGVLFENPYKNAEIIDEKTGKIISINQIPLAKIFNYIALIINLEKPEKTELNILNTQTILDLESYTTEKNNALSLTRN